jgi:putative peptidoglycan lipid II flippase
MATTDVPPGEPAAPGSAHLTTAALVGVIALLGNALGFVRDVLIASIFGASAKTDAYLVGWTVPETTSTLLLEGALVFVFVPLFADELRRSGSVRGLVRQTMGPLLAVLAAAATATALSAPWLVHLLAPGLHDPHVAVVCVRLASFTIFFMGVAGYFAAVLRAHDRFIASAFVFLAYNAGILAMLLLFHNGWGIYSAAAGLAVGSALMVAVELPSFLRSTGTFRLSWRVDRGTSRQFALFVPVAAFALLLQAQVFIERFIGSYLHAGAISHLNYSMKTAQVPMTFVVAIAVVGFPSIARLAMGEDRRPLRDAVLRDARLGAALIAPATAGLIAFAPGVVHMLYQRGSFRAADTSATAAVMRLYALGLSAQVLQSILQLPFFAVPQRLRFPLRAGAIGLVVDAAVSGGLAPWWGARALALGNAVGITVVVVVLFMGIGRTIVPLDGRRFLLCAARVNLVAAIAAATAFAVATLVPGGSASYLGTIIGLPLVAVVYLVLGRVLRLRELVPVFDLGAHWAHRLSRAG